MYTPELPKFNNDSEYLSKEGFDNLQKKLNELKDFRRKEIAKSLEDARSHGDLSENTEYQSAQDEWAMNEGRIKEIEDILSRAVILKKEHGANVEPGSSVSIKRTDAEEAEQYFLVGPKEADYLAGKISYESPLGKALLSKKRGDKVEVLTPNGKINYTIIDVG